jgi:NAD(P)-dependent dehydrogenase (short-subunit alcohol dehydrogenase family)
MIARRSGCVINVTSGAGKRARAHGGPYAVSKFGVEGLTQTAAAEVAESGVRVNALNPGGTRTRMRAAAYPDEDPLTLPSPDDVAEFFLWMAGPECRANGASLDYREWIKNGKRFA